MVLRHRRRPAHLVAPAISPGWSGRRTVERVLAGRDEERAAIAALLDAARAGSGGSLVVSGVAGSGKSTLLADAEIGRAHV